MKKRNGKVGNGVHDEGKTKVILMVSTKKRNLPIFKL